MDVYHQTGHNSVWNIDSFIEDNAGSGLIFSPVNDSAEKILNISEDVKKVSFFDPQLYLPKSLKGKLSSFDYFPSNFRKDFKTSDFNQEKQEIAQRCIDFQIANHFKYVVIPSRYYEVLPSNFYEQFEDHLIEPFLFYYQSLKSPKKIILTIIVKQEQLMNDLNRDELLNWITGIEGIDGVYLIFENNFLSKQIKDSAYLNNALILIHSLKTNELNVHIGYTNIEGILYSIAGPDSISMGSYENLRQFNVNRFVIKEKGPIRAPNPRLYSRPLFQLIEYGYKDGIIALFPNWEKIFEDSRYKPLMFKEEYNWHFMKAEPYKHFFLLFSSQVSSLPGDLNDRIETLRMSFKSAIQLFKEMESVGIYLARVY
ncbi:MAG: hypothetical protein JXI43_02340 [Tissierellales bacterium]|nr:hypothetical protein [Tissierellales bacterium]